MKTDNAYIFEQLNDDSYKGIMVKTNGCLNYVGDILNKHYTSPSKVNRLINLGSLYSLGYHLKPSPLISTYGYHYDQNVKFKALQQPIKNALMHDNLSASYTNPIHIKNGRDNDVTYLSDRDSKSFKKTLKSLLTQTNDKIDYVYLFENDQWFVLYSRDYGNTSKKDLPVSVAIKKAHSPLFKLIHTPWNTVKNHFNNKNKKGK